jgi:hypothetical protein
LKFTPEQVKILEDLFAKEPYAKGKALQVTLIEYLK